MVIPPSDESHAIAACSSLVKRQSLSRGLPYGEDSDFIVLHQCFLKPTLRQVSTYIMSGNVTQESKKYIRFHFRLCGQKGLHRLQFLTFTRD